MKKLLIVLAVFVTASVFAQAPQKMSYQAVIRNSSSALITSTTVGMQISILQGSSTGTPVYVETQTPTSNVNGLVSLEIGTGITVDDFSTIDWSNGPYFIKTETDLAGGTNYTITGVSELLSVPYALHAKTAENITGSIIETDPIFGSSVASGITGTDVTNWNNKLDTEIDGSITNEIQILNLSNDTIYLTNGGFVKLPAGFNGQYSSLIGAPTNVSTFTNDAGYLTTEIDGSVTNEIQALSISNDTLYLSNGGFVKLPSANAWSLLGNIGTNPSTNFMGTKDTNDLVFKTNNTEKMRISSLGKVGIGTSGTTFPLEVSVPSTNGSQFNLKLTNLTLGIGNGVGILFAPDDAAIAKMGIFVERKAAWGFSTMHFLSRLTSDYTSADLSNSVMSLTQNGYLGIGTTTPSSLLNVRSSSYNLLKLETTGANSNANIDIATTGSGSAQFTQTGGAGGFTFYPNGVVGTPTLAIVPFGTTGNVGIGTTTPNTLLQVYGNSGNLLKLQTSNIMNTSGQSIGLTFATSADTETGRIEAITESNGNIGMRFYTYSGGANERFRISSTGNIGIGNSNPSAKLHIGNGTRFVASSDASIFLQSGNGAGSARDWKIYVPMTAGYLAFRDMGFDNLNNGMATDAMAIQWGTGNVGIGTTNPGSKLEVQGTIKIVDGSQGVNKVLTSNAAGLASWQALPSHYIGENYGGGIVFYIYDNGQHGLIASTVDQSVGLQWYNGINKYTGTTGDGLGAGTMNSTILVASQMGDNPTGNFAAKLCADYSITDSGVTYGDWYLPSIYELNLLYLQQAVVGGFANDPYWSSTETDNATAWSQNLTTGTQYSFYGKAALWYVRAIRAF
ncbi:MAG: hypothetical protein CO118_01030 [Flavobacteriales bacterium CG_4_9_14_3_um_filter_32_8]|nr:MAG: hypothetical protein CO118_01030 [Flavobacteriales bacterium CG_4_9_14_3_um_filter_32_8]